MTPFEADKFMDHLKQLFPRMADAEYAWTTAEWDVLGHQIVAIKADWEQVKAAVDNYRAGCKTVVPKMAELIAAVKVAAYTKPAETERRGQSRNLRVDIYRLDMGGAGGMTDVQVLSRHCHGLERDMGTDKAMEHFADCLGELGILRGEVLDIVANEFGPSGEMYRDTILDRWERERAGVKAARAAHKNNKARIGAGGRA